MSDLAPILQSFFTDRMITQKHVSPHTVRSYRDTFRLLLTFTQQVTGIPPWKLDVGHLDAVLITAFLRWLDTDRSNSPRTRNVRLAAIRSLSRPGFVGDSQPCEGGSHASTEEVPGRGP